MSPGKQHTESKHNLENIIGVKEAGMILGLAEGTVKNHCAEGRIKAKKIGKTWVIDKTQLEITEGAD